MAPATEFAALAGGEITVLHVATPGTEVPAEPGTLVSPRYIDQPQHEWSAWGQEFLDRLRAVGGAKDGAKARLAVARGDASEAILEFAKESDLIVMGWRGVLEHGHARTLRRVVRNTLCPVIVFRLTPDDHFSGHG